MISGRHSEPEYRSTPGVSQSMLKALGGKGGPARVRYGDVREDTKEQKFGRLIHTTILQPDRLAAEYCLTQLERENTKAWREAEALAMGRILVKQSQYDEARRIADAVRRFQPAVDKLMDGALVEQSFWFTDPVSGLLMKGRADATNAKHRVILDYKSTVDASDDFLRECFRWGYPVQDVHYSEGWQLAGGFTVDAFLFVAVEKRQPYLTGLYELGPRERDAARIERERLIELYMTCERTQTWPGYPAGIQTLSRGN